ncbi:MAG: tetratricopeptide repeat protein [Bacteroidales bacterium]|nr:tetratricopeptide repeat protein [Bacteroidales bacterium]
MKRIKSGFLFFAAMVSFMAFPSNAKNSVDSLKLVLQDKRGEEKLRVLGELADYYLNNNLDSNLFFLNAMKGEALDLDNVRYTAIANAELGLNSFFSGKYFDAEDFLQQAIQVQKEIGDTSSLAHSYNVLAGVYGESGQYLKSINTLFEAITIFESQHNLKGQITAYNNLGYLHMKLDDYTKARDFYQKAISIIDKTQIDYNKGFSFSNIGICYKESGGYDTALVYYNKALQQYREYETLNAIPMLYQSFGNLYAFRLHKPDSAFRYFNEGIELAQKYDPNSLTELYYSLGQLYYDKEDFDKSYDAYIQSLAVAENTDDLDGQMQAHYEIYRNKKAAGQLGKAMDHFEDYMTLKDSIDAKETRTSISRLVEKYENDKNKILIEQYKVKQKADQRLKAALGAGVGFLVILLVFIVYALFQRKRRNILERELLHAEKQKVEEELQFKNKQLASQTLMMLQKNNMLQELHESIKEVENKPSERMPGFLNSFRNQINRNLHSEKDWELFKLYFEQVNKTFFKNLNEINSELTQNDLRLAALIKLRFNIKEAASVLNLSPNSIKGARSRLRNKLHLEKSEDLAIFIEGVD